MQCFFLSIRPQVSKLSPHFLNLIITPIERKNYQLKPYFKSTIMKIKAILHPVQEGGYWAEVPALPGCIIEKDS